MKKRRYNLKLSDKEPFFLLTILLEARQKKELEFEETLNPEVLDELQILKRQIKELFRHVLGEKPLPSPY